MKFHKLPFTWTLDKKRTVRGENPRTVKGGEEGEFSPSSPPLVALENGHRKATDIPIPLI